MPPSAARRMKSKSGVKMVPLTLGDVLFHLVWPMDKIRFIPVTGYLIDRIPAYRAFVQMVQHFELVIEIQLFVK
jgi:hypothetical protein